MQDSYAPPKLSRFWPRVNVTTFVVAHAILVLGIRFTFDTIPSLFVGVVVGLAAYGSWRARPELWRRPWLAAIFVLASVIEVPLFDALIKPPPDPPALALERQKDGTYLFNRGGDILRDRVYLVIPEKTEEASSPFILGAAKVVHSVDGEHALVEWIVMRKRFAGRSSYHVRPVRKKEVVPFSSSFATIIELPGEKRATVDVGEAEGVSLGAGYAVFHPGVMGSGGYLIIDQLQPHTASGYLVDVDPQLKAPHDVDLVAPVKNLVQLSLVKGDVAFQGGRPEDARVAYQQALDLSGGQDERAKERLRKVAAQ